MYFALHNNNIRAVLNRESIQSMSGNWEGCANFLVKRQCGWFSFNNGEVSANCKGRMQARAWRGRHLSKLLNSG